MTIDIFAFLTKSVNTEYVTYSTLITLLVGIASVVTLIGVPMFQAIFKKLDALQADSIEIKTLLRLTLLREGVDFPTQEAAVKEAMEKHRQDKK